MASLGRNNMISELRDRKRLRQIELWHSTELSSVTLSRFNNKHQSPYDETFKTLMEFMKLPTKTLLYPCLEDVTADIMLVRDEILHMLEFAADDLVAFRKAKELLAPLAGTDSFRKGINRQFILSCQAQINLIENKDTAGIIDLTKEGLRLTYPEFDPSTFNGDMLLFEEPNLIHTQALAYARYGDRDKGVDLLQRITTGLARLPKDDRDKERLLAPILLSLTRLLTEAGEYTQALETCETGSKISIRRNKGKHTPDFVYAKAQALAHLGHRHEIADLLPPAYLGFIALRKKHRAQEVLAFAKNMGMRFETYGAEHLPSQMPEAVFERGKSVTYKSIGELIHKLRTEANMSQSDLCKGICDKATLSRIERGEIQGSVYHLEGFMQRLGRSIDCYFTTFLSNRDFEEKQLRDEVRTLNANKRFEEADVLLVELEKKKAYEKGINLQFVKLTKAEIYQSRNGYNTTHMEMLMNAWRVTQEDKDIHDIATTRLTNYEIIILNNMAINLCVNNNKDAGLKLFENLRNNINHFYVDWVEKARTYLLVAYNYTKFLGPSGQHYRVLDITTEGLESCALYGDLRRVPGLAVNKACALTETGQTEKSAPYFVMAHYLFGLFGRPKDQKFARQQAKKHFGVTYP